MLMNPWTWVLIAAVIGFRGIDELTVEDRMWKKVLAALICGWIAGMATAADFSGVRAATSSVYRGTWDAVATVVRDVRQIGRN